MLNMLAYGGMHPASSFYLGQLQQSTATPFPPEGGRISLIQTIIDINFNQAKYRKQTQSVEVNGCAQLGLQWKEVVAIARHDICDLMGTAHYYKAPLTKENPYSYPKLQGQAR